MPKTALFGNVISVRRQAILFITGIFFPFGKLFYKGSRSVHCSGVTIQRLPSNILKDDELVKSRHSGENRSPDAM
jgi:hypothetical protein